MGTTIRWDRTEDSGSVGVTVNDSDGPETGATVVVRFRDPDSADLWLDHNDQTWKTNATVTTLDLALVEVDATDAPGRYEVNLDFNATTGYPAASNRIEAIYVVTSPAGFPTDVDTIEFNDDVSGIPAQVWDYDVTTNYTTAQRAATAGGALRFLRLVATNRQVEDSDANGSTSGTLELYEDNGITVAVTYTLTDEAGNGLTVTSGVPAQRSAGV